MPNIKSAKKRLKTSAEANLRNKRDKTMVRTSRCKFMEAIEAGNVELSTELFKKYCSALDKAVKRNVIKRNTAIRSKSRAEKRVVAISKPAAA